MLKQVLTGKAVFTLKLKHPQSKHVSPKHVCYCIVHIRCQFQTHFMPGSIINAVSSYRHLSLSFAAMFSPRYSAFYPLPIIAIVFPHWPTFQLDIWPHNSTNFSSFGHSPPLHICLPFWTCLVWSWVKLPRKVVSIMLRIIMFQPWFVQCTVWCEHFS